MAILISSLAFMSTFLGGLLALKYRDRLHIILGFTAGVLLGVVAFEIFPEIFELTRTVGLEPTYSMIGLVVGYLLFHILEKLVLIHQVHEGDYHSHSHPKVGILSALALVGHSFLDGVGIGLGFQISDLAGITIALAIIAHDFSDGLNTVSLMLIHNAPQSGRLYRGAMYSQSEYKNSDKRTLGMLFLDAIAPVVGALSTLLFTLPQNILTVYLGFFAGFLLYISSADILPEAHSHHSSKWVILMTILGVSFIYVVTRLNL